MCNCVVYLSNFSSSIQIVLHSPKRIYICGRPHRYNTTIFGSAPIKCIGWRYLMNDNFILDSVFRRKWYMDAYADSVRQWKTLKSTPLVAFSEMRLRALPWSSWITSSNSRIFCSYLASEAVWSDKPKIEVYLHVLFRQIFPFPLVPASVPSFEKFKKALHFADARPISSPLSIRICGQKQKKA